MNEFKVNITSTCPYCGAKNTAIRDVLSLAGGMCLDPFIENCVKGCDRDYVVRLESIQMHLTFHKIEGEEGPVERVK